MGVFAITGGSSGIGAKTVELLKKAGHEVINIDLRDGDIIVLSSDGIAANDTPDGDGGLWLSELFGSADKSDLDALAEKIVEAAKLHEKRSDDMTVELVRVKSIAKGIEKAPDEPLRTVA